MPDLQGKNEFILVNLARYAIIARMIERMLYNTVREALAAFPAVALLGPRQIGKTTLALALAEHFPALYLDLESAQDLSKLTDAEHYLSLHEDKLIIIDEIQRAPRLFQTLRGLIDSGRRKGLRYGRFLLLGSASIELIKQSSETLAGRLATLELAPLTLREVDKQTQDSLFVRGGFPDSFLAANDDLSYLWRENFIRTYLERDIPLLGPRIPAETLRRFWTMLAHHQAQLLNAAQLARALAVDGKTIVRYLDLMVDLLLVRRLPPWHNNVGKRLVKSPKIFVRDSGLVHALLGLKDYEGILGHPIAGASWEGFVIENIMACLPVGANAHFYRTSAGAEIDLLLTLPNHTLWAIEIKRSTAPKLSKGFYLACEAIQPDERFVIYGGEECYSLGDNVQALGIGALLDLLVE